jgi:hypothetical protein
MTRGCPPAIELLRIREEQRRAATLLLAGHPDQAGLTLAIADWMAEELLLEGDRCRS